MEFIDLAIEGQFPGLSRTVKRAYASPYDTNEQPINIDITEKEMKDIYIDFRDHHVNKTVKIIDGQVHKFDNIVNRNTISLSIIQRIAVVWTRFERLMAVNMPNHANTQWWVHITATTLFEDFRPITKKLVPM